MIALGITALLVMAALWFSRSQKSGPEPYKSPAGELIALAKKRHQEYLEQRERILIQEDKKWHEAHEHIEVARKQEEQKQQEARLQRLVDSLTELFDDAELARDAAPVLANSISDVCSLFEDGIRGNEPRDFSGEIVSRFITGMRKNSRFQSWLVSASGGARALAKLADDASEDDRGILKLLRSGKFAGSGTGFWISPDGWLITNQHVIGTAETVELPNPGAQGFITAKVRGIDAAKDLALLKADIKVESWLKVTRGEPPLGRSVFTVGFPQPTLRGVDPKFERGDISGLNGVDDDPSRYTINVELDHGNSGGPLVEMGKGWVVGVVAAGFHPSRVIAYQIVNSPPEPMKTDKCPAHTDEPNFESEAYLETMEIQETLRDWHRKHVGPRQVSHGGEQSLAGVSDISSAEVPGRPRRPLWLFWRRRPAFMKSNPPNEP